ncbi:MAG: hypothetical protein IT210_04920 [Armatimonadetes bacterium]|nr:hypothetical protein [Armatimonadota bacterium]
MILSHLLGRHFTNFYRFLESNAWATEAPARQVWRLCVPYSLQGGGRLFVALDDTVAQKTGKHFGLAPI